MKRTLIALMLLAVIFILWLQPLYLGQVEVTIPQGAHAKEITEFLQENQVVRDKQEFLFWLRLTGREKDLKSGTYTLEKYRNPLYLIHELTQGGTSDIVVTIPEGLTLYEIADILDVEGLTRKEDFVALCKDRTFVERLGYDSSLEGFLFPDTYSFSLSQSDSQIIKTFLSNFIKHVKKFNISQYDSLRKVIIIASLVEKEAKVQEERPVIAKIFINRLKSNRPLESCATVLYALKSMNLEKYQKKDRLLERDLKFESPYNTYLHTGLPPGPICSPGESSIDAVVNPADVDFLYFVARGDGTHQFSRTYREHIAAKEKYNAQK